MREDVDDVSGRSGAETHPPAQGETEHQQNAERLSESRPSAVRPRVEAPVHHEEQAVVGAPDDEIPRRTVPEPPQKHSKKKITIGIQGRAPIPAQRDVEVVSKPRRQRDVPSLPESARAVREVRQAKVEHEVEAHQLRHAASDVRIAGEVAVDLKGEGQRAEHDVQPRGGAEVIVDRVGDGRHVVGDHHLFEIAPQDQKNTRLNLRPLDAPWIQTLLHQMRCALNGSSDELWEERNE